MPTRPLRNSLVDTAYRICGEHRVIYKIFMVAYLKCYSGLFKPNSLVLKQEYLNTMLKLLVKHFESSTTMALLHFHEKIPPWNRHSLYRMKVVTSLLT